MRLFVAVWPAGHVVEALGALHRPEAAGVRWTRPQQWHVTLRFLGEVADAVVPDLTAALGGSRAAVRRGTLGPSTVCFGRSILVAPVAGLDDLASDVARASSPFARAGDDRPFSGHLTLARGRDVRRFTGMAVAASWVVDEMTLVCSTTAPDGARYDVLARFPLA